MTRDSPYKPPIVCKHAVIGLTRTVAIEYAVKGIRINAICPDVIRTPMLAGGKFRRWTCPWGRWCMLYSLNYKNDVTTWKKMIG